MTLRSIFSTTPLSAHHELLANVKSSKMDRSVVNDMIRNDVAKRESDVVASLSPESQTMINDLLAEANKHIGKPYRHGMKGPNAFACSGSPATSTSSSDIRSVPRAESSIPTA